VRTAELLRRDARLQLSPQSSSGRPDTRLHIRRVGGGGHHNQKWTAAMCLGSSDFRTSAAAAIRHKHDFRVSVALYRGVTIALAGMEESMAMLHSSWRGVRIFH
jgi:hypothetical protein